MKSLMKVMLLAVALSVLAGCGDMATQGTKSGATTNKVEPPYDTGSGGY